MDEVQAFAAHLLRDRRRSVHTVRAYVATAERLTLHLGGTRVPEPLELRGFLAARRSGGLCNASAARELSAVRSFLEFIGGADASPRLKGPRVKKGVPRPVSPAEAVASGVVANSSWTGNRSPPSLAQATSSAPNVQKTPAFMRCLPS